MEQNENHNLHEHLERLERQILSLTRCYETLHNMICHRRDEVENNINSKLQKLFSLLDSKIRELKEVESGKMEVIMPPKLIELTQTMAFIAKRFHKIEERLQKIELDRNKEFTLSVNVQEKKENSEIKTPLEQVLELLNDRQRTVIVYRYLMKDKNTLKQTGIKMCVSQERIRQTEMKSLRILRDEKVRNIVEALPQGRLRTAIFGES